MDWSYAPALPRPLERDTVLLVDQTNEQPGPLVCRSCKRPIKDEVYLVAHSPCCAACTGYLHVYQSYCRFSLKPWLRALVAGLAVGTICAIFWAWAAGRTTRQDGIGLFSIFVGVVLSKLVVAIAGRRRGPSILVLTIGLSILTFMIAKGLMASWIFWPQVQARGILAGLHWPWRRVAVFLLGFVIQIRIFDLTWYAILFFAGWTIGRLPRIPISGPHRPEDIAIAGGR